MTGAAARGGAFFGRRKGHRLRPARAGHLAQALPRLRVDPAADLADPNSLFGRPVARLHLEIGFGGGEHLLARARAAPGTGFIGCEPFVNGMARLVATVVEEGLDNIRLHDGDAGIVIDALPDASLSGVDLLYPDPWPKRRHHKRRFVSDAMLARLARVMQPGAVLRFASDIDHYVGWTLARVMRSPDFRWLAEGPGDWREPFEGWPGTRYEAKALREGRRPSYLRIRRL